MGTNTTGGGSPDPFEETRPARDDKSTSHGASSPVTPEQVAREQHARPLPLPSPPRLRLPRPLPQIPLQKHSSRDRRARSKLRHAPLEPVPESDSRDLRNFEQPKQQPQQQTPTPVHDATEKVDQPSTKAEVARRKSDYFQRAFAISEWPDPAVDAARNASPVLADVQTNVIVEDEFLFVTGLASFLAERYHRPIGSTAITLRHSACVFMAGSFEPTYIVTVQAMPSLVQPTMNKRNIFLLQRYLEKSLRVPLSRAFVRFVAMPEDSFGMGGGTMQALLEDVHAEKWEYGKTYVPREQAIEALSRTRPSSRLAMLPKENPSGEGSGELGARDSSASRDEATSPPNGSGSSVIPEGRGSTEGKENGPGAGHHVPKRKKSFLHSLLKRSTQSLSDLKTSARTSSKEEKSVEGKADDGTSKE